MDDTADPFAAIDGTDLDFSDIHSGFTIGGNWQENWDTSVANEAWGYLRLEVDKANSLMDSYSHISSMESILQSESTATTAQFELVGVTMESARFIDSRLPIPIVSMEGIGEFLKAIWDIIKRVVSGIWNAIKNFFRWIFTSSTVHTAKEAELRMRIQALMKKPHRAKHSVTRIALSRNDNMVFSRTDVHTGSANNPLKTISMIDKVSEVVFKGVSETIEDSGEAIQRGLKDMLGKDAVGIMLAIKTILDAIERKTIYQSLSSVLTFNVVSVDENVETIVSHEVSNGYRFRGYRLKNGSNIVSLKESKDTLLIRALLSFEFSREGEKEYDETREFGKIDLPPLHGALDYLNYCDRARKYIDDFDGRFVHGVFPKLDKGISDAGNHLVGRQNADNETAEVKVRIKDALSFYTVITKSIYSGPVAFAKYVNETREAAHGIASSILTHYEAIKDETFNKSGPY